MFFESVIILRKILLFSLILIYFSVSFASLLNYRLPYFPDKKEAKFHNKKNETKNIPVWTLRKHIQTIAKVSFSAEAEITEHSFSISRKYILVPAFIGSGNYLSIIYPDNESRAPPLTI